MCRQTCPFPLLLLCCLGQAFCGRANTTHLLVLEVASVPQSPPDASFYSLCSGLSLFLLNKKVLKTLFYKVFSFSEQVEIVLVLRQLLGCPMSSSFTPWIQ